MDDFSELDVICWLPPPSDVVKQVESFLFSLELADEVPVVQK